MEKKRIPLIAGNWKMYKTIAETRQLIPHLVQGLDLIEGVEKAICPPFTALLAVKALLEGSTIRLGAQNMHWENSGAFTGEISPLMVAELCTYVILGHSERRAYFDETDEMVNKKIKAAHRVGIVPILCVGETLQENEAGKTAEVVERQVKSGLQDVALTIQPDGTVNMVIAYEPVWAIGTGRAASGEGANMVVSRFIRPSLAQLFGNDIAKTVQVLYGGSVKSSNASEFFSQPDIDGALVGGASLKADEFIGIVQAAA